MAGKSFSIRIGMGSFPKQDLDSLIGSKQTQIRPHSDGQEFEYSNYKGCSIELYIPGNPHVKTQQISISGEPEDFEKVVKEFRANYSWAKSLTSNPNE